jgi:hypothetical protein
VRCVLECRSGLDAMQEHAGTCCWHTHQNHPHQPGRTCTAALALSSSSRTVCGPVCVWLAAASHTMQQHAAAAGAAVSIMLPFQGLTVLPCRSSCVYCSCGMRCRSCRRCSRSSLKAALNDQQTVPVSPSTGINCCSADKTFSTLSE